MEGLKTTPVFQLLEELWSHPTGNSLLVRLSSSELSSPSSFLLLLLSSFQATFLSYQEAMDRVLGKRVVEHLGKLMGEWREVKRRYEEREGGVGGKEERMEEEGRMVKEGRRMEEEEEGREEEGREEEEEEGRGKRVGGWLGGTLESLEGFGAFWEEVERRKRVLDEGRGMEEEVGRVREKVDGFEFGEEAAFFRNRFISKVLNEVMPLFNNVKGSGEGEEQMEEN